jgi:hypothetical protein
MTEEERQELLKSLVWFWFPVRWMNEGSFYEIKSFEISGTVESGSLDIYVSKDDGDPTLVQYSNADCYGESVISVETARTRIYDTF